MTRFKGQADFFISDTGHDHVSYDSWRLDSVKWEGKQWEGTRVRLDGRGV